MVRGKCILIKIVYILRLKFVFSYGYKLKYSKNDLPVHVKQNSFYDGYNGTKTILLVRNYLFA